MFHLAKNPEEEFLSNLSVLSAKWSICSVGTELRTIPSCPCRCSPIIFLFCLKWQDLLFISVILKCDWHDEQEAALRLCKKLNCTVTQNKKSAVDYI